MIKKISVLFFLILILLSISCAKKSAQAVRPDFDHVDIENNAFNVKDKDGNIRPVYPVSPSDTKEDVAYALAMNFIYNIKGIFSEVYGIPADTPLSDSVMGSFLQGVLDAEGGKQLDQAFMMDIGNRLQKDADERNAKKAEAAEKYFKSIESKSGVSKTDSGLMYEIINEGNGKAVTDENSKVNVNYVMSVYSETAENNIVEADKNDEIVLTVSNLIPGAIEGLKLMREGSEYIFYIKPDLGYGPVAVSPTIGPNSYLVFRVKINKIVEEEPAADAPSAN